MAFHAAPGDRLRVRRGPFAEPFRHSDVVGAGILCEPNLIIDLGFDHGLTATSTQWQGIAGFTYLLPHGLWNKRQPAAKAIAKNAP